VIDMCHANTREWILFISFEWRVQQIMVVQCSLLRHLWKCVNILFLMHQRVCHDDWGLVGFFLLPSKVWRHPVIYLLYQFGTCFFCCYLFYFLSSFNWCFFFIFVLVIWFNLIFISNLILFFLKKKLFY